MYAAVAALSPSSSSVSTAVGALRQRAAPSREAMNISFFHRTLSPVGRSKRPSQLSSLSVSCSSSSSSSSVGSVDIAEEAGQPKPWLFVGLGNPGKLYEGTRHNVGFDMVDFIGRSEGITVNSIRSKALFGKGQIGDSPVMIAKPQTFMNASGGHGGHNGMRSVIHHFKGVKDFPRLRIGIGRPPGKMEAKSYVLKPFNKKELEELSFMYQTGLEAVRILLRDGFDKSATFVNSGKSTKLLN